MPDDKTNIVIDTCVFISALRSRRGASFRLLSLVGSGKFEIELSTPVGLEYEAVGRRILSATALSESDFEAILDFVCQSANHRDIFYSWRPSLADPGDDMVLELAVAAGGATIITYNQADFRGAEKFGVRILRPQEFLTELGELSS